MRIFYRVSKSSADELDAARLYHKELYGFHLLPMWVQQQADILFYVIANEYVALYLETFLDIEEYLEMTDTDMYTNVLAEVICERDGDERLDELYSSLEQLSMYEDTEVISSLHRKLKAYTANNSCKPFSEYCEEDLIEALHNTTLDMVIGALRELDFNEVLDVAEIKTYVYDDVRVDLKRRRILLYQLRS